MKSCVGAGPFEGVGSEGFNRTERARGPHTAGGRPARRPGEHRACPPAQPRRAGADRLT